MKWLHGACLRVLMTDDIQKVKVAVKVGDNEWRSLFVLQMHNFQSLIFLLIIYMKVIWCSMLNQKPTSIWHKFEFDSLRPNIVNALKLSVYCFTDVKSICDVEGRWGVFWKEILKPSTQSQISFSQDASKLTYSNVEFQKFPGVVHPDPRLKRRGEIRLGGIVLQLRAGSGIRAV